VSPRTIALHTHTHPPHIKYLVCGIRVGARLEQHLHRRRMAPVTRQVQRRLPTLSQAHMMGAGAMGDGISIDSIICILKRNTHKPSHDIHTHIYTRTKTYTRTKFKHARTFAHTQSASSSLPSHTHNQHHHHHHRTHTISIIIIIIAHTP
jgi:hypothetical protein